MGSRPTLRPRTWSADAGHGAAVYAPHKIAVVLRTLADEGVAAAELLAGTGLDAGSLLDPATRTSIGQFLAVCRHAMRLTRQGALGLRVGQRMRISTYGMYGYALMCAESFRHGMQMAVRFHRLATPVLPLEWREDARTVSWIFPGPGFAAWARSEPALFAMLLEMQLAIHAVLATGIMGPDCVPLHAALALPAPPHAEQFAAVLRCPVRFDQPASALAYPIDVLDRVPEQANPITAAEMSETCARLLERTAWDDGVAQHVVRELTRVPGRFPGIDEVASTLHMTSRTLRRRLDAEGSSYSELLAEVRQALALDYLTRSMLATDDIAAALGFSDGASFRHAFRRWTGKAPSEYRR